MTAALRIGSIAAIVAAMAGCATQEERSAPPDPMAEQRAWMEYSTPGAPHRLLGEHFVGDWNLRSVMWMQPGGEPMTSTMTSSTREIKGGRFFRQTIEGQWDMGPGMPPMDWEGTNVFGYDNIKDAYVFAWWDDSSTGIVMGEGTIDDNGRVYTWKTVGPDVLNRTYRPMKMVTTILHENRHKSEFFLKDDGAWWLHMEMTYTRK
jgi:hypothetical protein